jgi:predicted metalloendopeptidase
MDTGLVDQKGVTPIQPAWAMIASLSDSRQLPSLLGTLENDGTPYGFFDTYVAQDDKDSTQQIAQLWQGGLSLPDRDYYIDPSKHFEEIRGQYLDHMKKMFTLAGDPPEQPEPGKAPIYFIRDSGAVRGIRPTAEPIMLGLDGAWAGANHESSYFFVSV